MAPLNPGPKRGLRPAASYRAARRNGSGYQWPQPTVKLRVEPPPVRPNRSLRWHTVS